jgi:hypothetical protein
LLHSLLKSSVATTATLLLWLLLLQLCHVLQKRYASFDAVVSSDLQRTLQTAQILAAPYQLQVITVITML